MGKLRNYFLNHYPRTDFHELNQDWMITMLYDMINQVENFVEMNSVKYADPIQWSITSQYEKNTIVVDGITGTAYISSKPVPMGVALSRAEYWSVIFDLGRFVTLASQNFANSYEAVLTTTATMPTDKDGWIVWNSLLYRAKNDIHTGDMYVVDGNIERYTVEMFFDELAHLIAEETEARIEADTALHDEIVDESVARENADTALQDNIDAEATARESADTTLQDNIDAEAVAREDADEAEAEARENADNALSDRIDLIQESVLIDVTKNGVYNDGTYDNTVIIQELLNSYAGKGILYFPAGVYLTRNLLIPSNTHIYLEGELKLLDNANTQLLYSNSTENITIEGHGVLNGNKSHQTTNIAIACILFGDASDTIYNVNNVLVKGITIKDALYWGVCAIGDNITFDHVTFANNNYMSFIGPNSKNGKFLHCEAYGASEDWGLGFYGGVDGGVIDGCYAHNNHQCGLGALSDEYQPTPSKNITITNCLCHDNGYGIACGGWVGAGYNINISNNTCYHSSEMPLYSYGGLYVANVVNSVIADNVINDTGNANYIGIITLGECTRLNCSNNIVSIESGVAIGLASTIDVEFTIANNVIHAPEAIKYLNLSAVVDNIIIGNNTTGTVYIPVNNEIDVKDNTFKTMIITTVTFPVDGTQTTFLINTNDMGLIGDLESAIVVPRNYYGSTPSISTSTTAIGITFPTAPLSTWGNISFDIIVKSALYD